MVLLFHGTYSTVTAEDNQMEFIAKAALFCEAHELCYLRGQAKNMIGYMVGYNYHSLLNRRPSHSDFWVNIHILLHHNNADDEQNWICGEGISTLHGITQYKMGKRESRDSLRAAIFTTYGKLKREGTANKTYSYGCEYRYLDRRGRIVQKELFHAGIVQPLSLYADSNSTSGCFNKTHRTSLIDCAMR
ncbi:hypothetical protein FBUS_03514 [Fasciolopsis buskii]|uniref:Uncharacterized protein n=1 Tax=Fasciolopsis buskii TaxID=27845 RepID=A0A8E0RVM9_9TREM|nr:hypothetical protein FBUS_03514 [Fasciolopsis buski]